MSKKKNNKVVNKSVVESMPLFKYFLKHEGVHPYSRAYLEERYRGIMKTEDEWKQLVNQYIKE